MRPDHRDDGTADVTGIDPTLDTGAWSAVRGGASRARVLPRTVLIFLRRDLADRQMFRASLLLDLAFGLLNLVSFMFISKVLHHPGAALGGAATYFDFVAVGLAYLLVVQSTCTQLLARVQEHQRSGTLEVLVASPAPPALLVLGMGTYPTLLGMLRSTVYLGFAGVLLGLNLDNANWLGAVVVLTLGAAAALAIGSFLAAFAVAFRLGSAVGKTVIVALGLLSGVYFPAGALPFPLPAISAALPTTMAIDALRAALAGASWVPGAVLLAGWVAVGLPLSAVVFARALRRARRIGTLVRA